MLVRPTAATLGKKPYQKEFDIDAAQAKSAHLNTKLKLSLTTKSDERQPPREIKSDNGER